MDDLKETTGRLHVYQEPAAEHNMRDEDLIENENKSNQNRWIDPTAHEVWPGADGALTEEEAGAVLFEDPVKEYNEKQEQKGRKDRKKTVAGYLEEVRQDDRGRPNRAIKETNARAKKAKRPQDVRKEKGKHVSHELIVSLGNVRTRIPEDEGKKILKEYVKGFQARNKNFYMYRVDYHNGEYFRAKNGADLTDIGGPPGTWSKGVDHIHLSFIAWADGYKQGLSRQISSGKALRSMGYTDWATWEANERAELAAIAKEHGYEIVKAEDEHETALTPREYQELEDKKQELADESDRLARRSEKITVRESKLQEREMDLRAGQAKLKNDQAKAEAQMDMRGTKLDLREERLGKREDGLKEREDAVATAEAGLKEREKAVADREKAVADQEEAVAVKLDVVDAILERCKDLKGTMEERERLQGLAAQSAAQRDSLAASRPLPQAPSVQPTDQERQLPGPD